MTGKQVVSIREINFKHNEIKKAELASAIKWLIWSQDPTEGKSVDPYEVLKKKIAELQSELRKMEEDNE